VVTLTEVVLILQRNNAEADITRALQAIMRRSTVLEITGPVAVLAGRYPKRSFPGGIADRLIYATAQINECTLVTGDQHFQKIPGVKYIGD